MKQRNVNRNNLTLRITAVALVVMLLLGALGTTVFAAEDNSFDSSNLKTDTLLLMDADSNEVLFSKNSDTQVSIASVVKILTYIVAIENIENPEEKMIEIKAEAINEILGQGASTAGFENHIGESYSALDILYGLMLPSGCDAAQILALEVGGSEENFATMMNNKAAEIGCTDSYFTEAHGLSDTNYSTAKDIAKIAEYALTLPYFEEIVSSEYYTAKGYSYPYINTNYLIDRENGGRYYYPYATGIKTGYTSQAGKCLVSIAEKGEDKFICVALGGEYSSADNYINHAMTDSVSLYEWAFETYTENIYVDIENLYASVEIGETLKLSARTTSSDDEAHAVVWTSSNEEIATVDSNGVVTAKALGQAIVTATTSTGNFDYIYVSCGFYNGIDVTSRYGDYSTGVKLPLDWKAVKNYGFDFAVIRAGWGSEDYPNQNDAEFINNVKGAYQNDLPFLLSFVAYAKTADEAVAEADYFLREMEEYFPADCENELMTVVYNMTDSQFRNFDAETNTAVATAFAKKLEEKGYKTLIFTNKATFAKIDIDKLKENNIGTYYSYYPYSADFSTPINIPENFVPDMWQYRSDGYIPEASNNLNSNLCIMYMDSSFDISPSHPLDVNRDGKVSISDATYIQKVLALLIEAPEDFKSYGDANGDGKVSISDATYIQKYLADLI